MFFRALVLSESEHVWLFCPGVILKVIELILKVPELDTSPQEG